MEYIPDFPLYRYELADAYNITCEMLRNRLIMASINISSGMIFPKDLIRIFEVFGNPFKSKEQIEIMKKRRGQLINK